MLYGGTVCILAEQYSITPFRGSIMKRFLLFVIPLIILAVLVLCTGCTSRGDSGRLLGLTVDLSVGENTSVVTTAGDETEAGENITGFKPTPEATRGFETLDPEVSRD